MGVNDTLEQLEAARALVGEQETEIATLRAELEAARGGQHTESKHWAEVGRLRTELAAQRKRADEAEAQVAAGIETERSLNAKARGLYAERNAAVERADEAEARVERLRGERDTAGEVSIRSRYLAHALLAERKRADEAEAERDEWRRRFADCHPIHLDGVQKSYELAAVIERAREAVDGNHWTEASWRGMRNHILCILASSDAGEVLAKAWDEGDAARQAFTVAAYDVNVPEREALALIPKNPYRQEAE